ncbi:MULTISPECIES: PTS sugar transporter subunit IIB [unclassified Microbacterium]|uniref:PTS sugar transporter subunit IIB n=1 Tax=unclassified Microbacterium TaxID=2609290 RepID=UPI000EA9F040|nr:MULTISPECIES: hypothetical protein [unclassified Microbacterium]MBT2486780.1 hypothetical protein [Microbacterium sp. ISL-108]RKN64708.1 hypothetical protein D7252_18965 [Microbacterium sp. CGR2]
MKILVVCGAGASSTFVALRLRRAASAAGLDWETAAGTESAVRENVSDVILLGPHLADRLDSVRGDISVPVVVLPDDVFGDREGTRTLALVRSILADDGTTLKGTP